MPILFRIFDITKQLKTMNTLLYQGKSTMTEDLQKAIDDGMDFGCNNSPTIRAKQIWIVTGKQSVHSFKLFCYIKYTK
jgi:hypothetical protein